MPEVISLDEMCERVLSGERINAICIKGHNTMHTNMQIIKDLNYIKENFYEEFVTVFKRDSTIKFSKSESSIKYISTFENEELARGYQFIVE